MSALLDRVLDTFPASGDTGVPLSSTLTFTLSGINYDEDSLTEGFFLEGPDTDQFVGPGILLFQDDNVSQNDMDDFFASPGRRGIVPGTTTITTVSGNTLLSFVADRPFAATTEYTMNLTEVLELDGITPIAGFITIDFTSGSGSIEAVPTETSSSVLSSIYTSSGAVAAETLSVLSTSPVDRSIENSIELSEITVTFSSAIDPSTVTASSVTIQGEPVTDHPNVSVSYAETLAKELVVTGNVLTIKIQE